MASSVKFGTDGWRAVIADSFTFDNLGLVSQAVADFLMKKKKKNLKVVIGFDARFMSKEFAEKTAGVLLGNNIKVILSDEKVSTPAVSFYAKYKNCGLGIMITASHNPYYFNGFKIKNSQGGAADNNITSEVEKLLGRNKVKEICLNKAPRGLFKRGDLTKDYLLFIKRYVNLSLIKKLKLNVLVDLMYGSGGSYIKDILAGSKINISYLNNEFNPSFGGIRPEPIEPNLQKLMREMKKGRYDLGIALDGDADRIACVLPGGRYVNAQVLLPLLAWHLVHNRGFSGGIVKTVVGSNLIDNVASALGRVLYETPVGFKYISRLFQTENVVIGGEEAGGIGVKDYIPERDGTMAALLLMEMLAFLKTSPLKLIKGFEDKFGRWYYARISVPSGRVNKRSLNKLKIPKRLSGRKVERVNRLDGIKIITKDNWLMFRASGTEPIVRIYSEAKNRKEADQLLAQGRRMLNGL